MEPLQKIVEKTKEVGLTDIQRTSIYSYTTQLSKDTINEICPALLRIILNSEKGALKNELGRVIFHLQKTERINTIIGAQKLIDASIIVAPEEMFKILEESDADAQELAEKIKSVL